MKKMNFTDIFVHRPVLSMVISLAILIVGACSFALLPVRQYPYTQNAVISVTTAYFGASSDIVADFLTTPLEAAIAQADGIDYMTSSSRQGISTIQIKLHLNYDPNKALSEILSLVSSVRSHLPPDAQQPVVTVSVDQTTDAMYLSFNSNVIPLNTVTDYLARVVQPRLQSIPGVQQAELIGAKRQAIRVWIDPIRLASYGLTAADVSAALENNDFISALGTTRAGMVQVNLTATTNVKSINEFRNLIVSYKNGSYIHLSDVANIVLGSEDYNTQASFDGKPAIQIGIKAASSANVLDVAKEVREVYPSIISQLPQGIEGHIAYDSTRFIDAAMYDVTYTLLETVVIVVLVIFGFLGSRGAAIIPLLTIPLSLIGVGTVLLAMGYSINLLTLLALILAVGLVVDDAIIIVENVSRHIEEGTAPVTAALRGVRELAGPIVAIALVLIAVYLPIAFIGGVTGALFVEFAVTLVSAILVSTITALTLSPMLAGRMLLSRDGARPTWDRRLVAAIDRYFDILRARYTRLLHIVLDQPTVTAVFALMIMGGVYGLLVTSQRELAPQEDQGLVLAVVGPAPTATLDQLLIYQQAVLRVALMQPETAHVFQLSSPPLTFSGDVLIPASDRRHNSDTVQYRLQRDLSTISGIRAVAVQPPSLPGPQGLGVQFVIQSAHSFEELARVVDRIMEAAYQSGAFVFLDSDLKIDQPRIVLVINRNKAANLGLTMRDIGASLTAFLGGGYVNYVDLGGRSYEVIPQVQRNFRLNPKQLENYFIRTASGAAIPISTLASLKPEVVPESLNHFQQRNSATISAVPVPGMTMGDALSKLRQMTTKILPSSYFIDYAGPAREYVEESNALLLVSVLASVVIFLTLAALFESFRDALTILVSVPMSVFGALIFIALGIGHASLNIYTEVGLVTLAGLVSKHGILIIWFANDLRLAGLNKRAAIERASAVRLRPILMTTAAMVLGVLPLVLASGAGSAARFNMGLVIASGLSIGTCFTLFIVPGVYLLIAGTSRGGRTHAGATPNPP